MRYALVFSGQGGQHPQMLRWLRPDGLVQAMAAQLGAAPADAWRDRLVDPAWASSNRHAQPLLTGLGLAAWAQLAPALPPPAIVCGHSVGELAAFAAAGVFSAADALRLATQRAACMDTAAAQAVPTGLSGFSGAPPGLADALCARFGLATAIRSAPDAAVLGGPLDALAQAEAWAAAQGLRCTRLAVGLASHTPWMAAAVPAFAQVLATVTLQRPTTALFSNALGRVRSAEQAREALARQIAQTVAWDDCQDAIAAQGVQAVLEIGPGNALCRQWLARDPHSRVPARSADEFGSAQGLLAWLQRSCMG